MSGRYGIDEFYKFSFWLCIILLLINIFLKSYLLGITGLLLVIFTVYRSLSKNIYQRTKENNIYLKVKKKCLKPFINIERNIKDKDNVYTKCRKCKTTLKLPLPPSRGFKVAVCPECKKRVRFLCLKKQKVEIITKKGRKNL